MIETACGCGDVFAVPESQIGQILTCGKCGAAQRALAAEAIRDGEGSADFDARLEPVSGFEESQAHLFLGGVADITFGKMDSHPLVLKGAAVSRRHGRLVRVDFGPSRWKVVDEGSTNGTYVNGRRVGTEQELKDGDLIKIGGCELRYRVCDLYVPKAARPAASSLVAGGAGLTCPGCGKPHAAKAKICVDCGIDLKTGRAILTRSGVDENDVAIRTENVVSLISWIFWTGLYPVASDAFGTCKPYLIRGVAILTVVVSLAYLVSGWTSPWNELPAGTGFILWPPEWAAAEIPESELAELQAWAEEEQLFLEQEQADGAPAEQLTAAEVEALMAELAGYMQPDVAFRWYQLITHAFLHADLIHLAGNMLFLLVFGTRVNALIGNIATAVLYPLLAVGSALVHLYFDGVGLLGASGAIMGLAGMYLMFFPLNTVWMTGWIRWGLIGGFHLSYRVWAMRGFWVVLFYIAFDVLYTWLGTEDGVAHWAHLGGFGLGMVLALLLMVTRLVDARGGDLLSILLGRHAWAIVGRPNRSAGSPTAVTATVIGPTPVGAVAATRAAARAPVRAG